MRKTVRWRSIWTTSSGWPKKSCRPAASSDRHQHLTDHFGTGCAARTRMTMTISTAPVLDVLREVRAVADGFEVSTLPTAHGGVLGAHLLFQTVLVAERAVPGRR